MEKFLEKNSPQALTKSHQSALTEEAPAGEMVDIADTEHSGLCHQPPAPPSNPAEPSYEKLAQAVASLLSTNKNSSCGECGSQWDLAAD